MDAESFKEGLQQAFGYLSFRARTEQELRRYLTQKGHPPETVEAVLGRLRDLHYLDDGVFAVSWVESRRRSHPRGPRLLRAELHQKGVAREVADRAIADAAGDEREQALDAARARAGAVQAADYNEFGRKLGGFLMRRGFAGEIVWDVVRQLWGERSGQRPGLAD